jgi:hypothetical protein
VAGFDVPGPPVHAIAQHNIEEPDVFRLSGGSLAEDDSGFSGSCHSGTCHDGQMGIPGHQLIQPVGVHRP